MTEKRYNFGSVDDHYDEELLAQVRPDVLDSIERWVQIGCPTGEFLSAVIENNLCEALGRADETNRRTIHEIVKVFYNYVPDACWGSRDKRVAWQTHRGLRGLEAAPCDSSARQETSISMDTLSHIIRQSTYGSLKARKP